MIIDTHTHIYLNDFKDSIEKVMERANAVGVAQFYLPAIDSETFQDVLNLEEKYPNQCFAMTGLHPCSVKENYKDELAFVNQHLEKRKFVAIGEIGLDFYWDRTFEKEQYSAFEQQLQWALDYNVPISIHTRNAMGETIEAVKPFAKKGLRGIFHCFGGSVESAKEIIKMGFYLGIGGVVTYKKAGLAETLVHIDLNHLVLETDAPYLTPVPFRGKQNEPSYLQYVIEKIAEVKNCNIEEVKRVTTANALQLFGILQ
jgi:TatD DNase family protein